MEKLIYRPILERIRERLGKNRIIILMGPRQTGKTSLMLLLKASLETDGKNVLYCDCEGIEYREIFSDYNKAVSFLKGKKGDFENGLFLFLDEFQKTPNISNTLKLFADHNPNITVIASGSSSLEIRKQMDESMAGRKRVIEIFPLTFAEALLFSAHSEAGSYENYVDKSDWSTALFFKEAFNEYAVYGGLPRIPKEPIVEEKKAELKEIYDSYLLKDIRSYVKEEKAVPFNKLLRAVAAQVGSLVSMEELSSTVGLKRAEVEDYLYILEQTHIIYLLQPFHTNLRKEITRMKKVYFYDTGLRNIILGSFLDLDARPDGGALFENTIISELMKHAGVTDQFYFWQTQQGTEVDLIIKREEKIIPVELKLSISSFRKLRGLRSFCEHHKIRSSFVVANTPPKGNAEEIQFIPACFAKKVL